MTYSHNQSSLPIGVFDSGMGGLTVLRSLVKNLPNESFIYLGDTARLPYGTKSKETICNYAHQAVNKLLDLKVKLIIIACNTATVSALDYLQNRVTDVPILGVVEPGAQACANTTKTNNIGIMATERTILSGCYEQTLKKINSSFVISTKACNIFTSLAEEGHIDDDIAKLVIKKYLDDLIQNNQSIDTVLLGCTHFPIFSNIIKELLPPSVSIVDSAECTSKFTNDLLIKNNIANTNNTHPDIKYYVTDSPERFKRIGGLFLGRNIGDINTI
jgi:glutamate racemase